LTLHTPANRASQADPPDRAGRARNTLAKQKLPAKILLVEDDPGVANLVPGVLAEAGLGHLGLDRVGTLAKAMASLERKRYSLVILDLGLPDSQGLDTFRILHGRFPQAGVLIFTGRQDEGLGVAAVQAGAQDYLVKDPSQFQILGRAVQFAMERQRLVLAREEAEQSLARSQEKYRFLVERLHDGLALTDPGGGVTFANRRLGQMLGYGRDDVGDLTLRLIGTQGRPGGGPERRERPSGAGWRRVYEARLLRKDGTVLDVLISESPLRDDSGLPLGGLVLVTDNTEHKQAEEMVRQAQKGESLARMAGGIAHDFNNLFQSLQASLEGIRHQLREPGGTDRALERCLGLVAEAAALTGKMLEYSGRGPLRTEGIDLGRLVRLDEGRLQSLAGPSCPLTIEVDGPLPEIAGDPHQLLQVVAALVCNAAEASGRTLRVAAGWRQVEAADLRQGYWPEPAPAGGWVALEVQDAGCGMGPELLGQVFDPFFTTKDPGRGLGLSSALGIIRAHHAWLQVDTAPGRGTKVRIYFPPRTGASAPAREDPVQARPPAAGRKTILLVDDDPVLRETLVEVLDMLGYAVLEAGDGLEAVEAFRGCPDRIDLVLMDATMPRMGGREAFSLIRELRPDVRALLCSGYSDSLSQEGDRQGGFVGFLKKPFSIEVLQDTLAKWLTATPAGPKAEA